MVAEIEKYIQIQNNIEEILKNSPFKMSYIIEQSGIKKPTFFRKLKQKKFNSEELLQIAKAVEAKVYRNETKEEILESIKRSEQQFADGKGFDGELIMKSFRERLEKYRNEAI